MTCEQCGGAGFKDVELAGLGLRRINCPCGCYKKLAYDDPKGESNEGTK